MRYIFLLLFFLSGSLNISALPVFRISVENALNHTQTKAVMEFADLLAERTAGKLDVQFYHSASLYRDKDVVSAVSHGKVEMAVPGIWQLDKLVPEVGIFLLPMFYNSTADFIHKIIDGPEGRKINDEIENFLDVAVAGRWLDLGFTHIFSTGESITGYEDFARSKIRVAGGMVNQMRIEALGAEAVLIPWPDLPFILGTDSINGVLTSFETVRSVEFWKMGLKNVFVDNEYFGHYIPIISKAWWKRISPEIREIIAETWDEIVDKQRLDAALLQEDAMAECRQNGMNIVFPDSDELKSAKKLLMSRQDEFVEIMGMDKAIVEEVMKSVDRGW